MSVTLTGPQVVHEDDDLLVVDKPGNLACHSSDRPTLASWLREHGIVTPRLVNRLDRETSGLIIVAKNERASKILGKAVLRREIEKEYIAICLGRFERETGVVDAPIGITRNSVVYTKRVTTGDNASSCPSGQSGPTGATGPTGASGPSGRWACFSTGSTWTGTLVPSDWNGGCQSSGEYWIAVGTFHSETFMCDVAAAGPTGGSGPTGRAGPTGVLPPPPPPTPAG